MVGGGGGWSASFMDLHLCMYVRSWLLVIPLTFDPGDLHKFVWAGLSCASASVKLYTHSLAL